MKTAIVASAAAGSTLALADRSGDVLVDRNGNVTTEPGLHATALAVTGAGTVLAGGADGSVRAFGGSQLARVGAPVLGLATGDDRFLVRTADEVRVYTDTGALVSTVHAPTDHAVLSPGGLGLATAMGNVAELWDATTGHRLHTLHGHTSAITDLAYSPGGLNLATVSVDHTGLIWSTQSGHLVFRLIGHFFPIDSVAYSPGGHWIVTSSHRAGLWNARTGRLMFYVGSATEPLTSAAFSPRGEWILTGSSDGTASVYDCQVCAPRERLERLAALRLARLAGN
jgi:WD40 repeat protein